MAVNTKVRQTTVAPHLLPQDSGYSNFLRGSRIGLNQIALSPFANKRTMGSVTLIQKGATGIRPFSFFIAGVDRSAFVDVTQTPSGSSQVNSRATCTFRTVDATGGGWTPTEGDDVKVYEGTTLIFNGSITRIVEERLIKTTVPRVVVTCGDAAVKMANRVVDAFYSLDLYGSPYFITLDVAANKLADLGISYVPRNGLADDVQIGDQLFNAVTVPEVLNTLAKLMNCDWAVDLNNNLRYIGLSDAISNGNSFSDGSGNWMEVKATRTLALEGNRIYAKSSAQLLQTKTDTFPGSPGGLYIMTYPPRDSNLLPVVKVNGVEKTVVSYNDASSGKPYDFYRIGTGVSMNGTETPLTSSDTVTVTYPSPIPYVAIAEDTADIATNGLKEVILECGNITSKSDLDAIAAAWLLRLKERATQLTITTGGNVDGTAIPASSRDWQPGQLVAVNFTSSGGATPVVDNFLVDTVAWTIVGNTIRQQALTLTNAQYQRTANPTKWMADIIARLRTIVLPKTQVLTLTQSTDLGSGYVLNVDQQINLDTSGGPFTVTLPPASEMYGNTISWMKISPDANAVTIVGAVVNGVQQNLNGQASLTISQPNIMGFTEGNEWQ